MNRMAAVVATVIALAGGVGAAGQSQADEEIALTGVMAIEAAAPRKDSN
jgi:hypothetical protein